MKCVKLILVFAFMSLLLSACGDSGGSHHASWESATLVAENASNPQVVSDGNGNLIAVWAQLDGIYTNSFNRGSGWGVPQKIADISNYWAIPRIALSRNGQFAAVWCESDGLNGYNINIGQINVATGWRLIGNHTGSGRLQDVAIENTGNLFLVTSEQFFDGSGFSTYKLTLARFSQTGGWGYNRIDSGEAHIFVGIDSKIALDGSGNGFVIWSEYYPSNNYKLFVRRFSQGVIGEPVQLAEARVIGWNNIVFDNNGKAMALWGEEDPSSNVHTYACRYTPAVGWGTALRIDDSSFSTIDQFLTVDHAGNFHAVWTQRTESILSDIFYCAYNLDSGWQRPIKIGTGGNGRYPRIAADSAGYLFAAWLQYDLNSQYPGDGKIYVNQSRAHSGWGAQTKLQQVPGDSGPQALAVYRPGEAMVIWSQTTGSVDGILSYGVFSSRFR
jgi:hypothetical protein